MEKYSKWRDPATGIQPFLTPIPPLTDPSPLRTLGLAIRYVLALVRLIPILLIALTYLIQTEGICRLLNLASLSSISLPLQSLSTRYNARLVLLFLGAFSFDVKFSSSTSRGRSDLHKTWKPKAGDVLISNWVSWIELLWFAYRFNPIFALPYPSNPLSPPSAAPHAPHTPPPSNISPPLTPLSLAQLLLFTGHTPASLPPPAHTATTLPSLQRRAKAEGRPICVLPEGTTTNGRGLLKFVDVFGDSQSRRRGEEGRFGVWLCCVKYPTPTATHPTLTHSIPSSSFPASLPLLPHILRTLSSSYLPSLSTTGPTFHLLSPVDAPQSDTSAGSLTKLCEEGVCKAGRIKRVGFGWEDKEAFLGAYRGEGKPDGKKRA